MARQVTSTCYGVEELLEVLIEPVIDGEDVMKGVLTQSGDRDRLRLPAVWLSACLTNPSAH
jgi:hypothetical protein